MPFRPTSSRPLAFLVPVVLAFVAGCGDAAALATSDVASAPASSGPSPSGSSLASAAASAAASPGAGASGTTSTGAASPSASAATAAVAPFDPRDDGFEVSFGEFAVTLEADAIRPGPVTFVIHNRGELIHGFEMRIERSDGDDEDRSGSGHGSDGGHGSGNSGSGSGSSGSGGSGHGRGRGGDRDDGKVELREFGPGETLQVEVTLEPGVYEIECYVADHDDRGMVAFLTVSADAPLATPAPVPSTPVAGTPADDPTVAAAITQFAFDPPALEVAAGTTVTWTNQDPAPHTVTADDGSFASEILEPGMTFDFTFATAGTYAYSCQIHPSMEGTVAVR